MIIALSGYARSGKDSVARFLVDHHGFTRVAFADAVRNTSYAINPIIAVDAASQDRLGIGRTHVRLVELVRQFGWEKAKTTPAVRSLLQDVGLAVREHVSGTAWIDAALNVAGATDRCVIADCRFQNEAETVAALGGYVVRIERPGFGPANAHVSEHELDDYPHFDATIANNGTLSDLGDATEKALAELGAL